MRSYYDHLLATRAQAALTTPLIFRSSALFPVWHSAKVRTRLLFLGYWFLKRGAKEMTQVVTLRDAEGKTLWRESLTFHAAKGYSIEVADLLARAAWQGDLFNGSIELEFHSLVNMVYPFPAAIVNYYGEGISSAVHTAQRVYNDYNDWRVNSEKKVAEGGFNVYGGDNGDPFISCCNGPEGVTQATLQACCLNERGELLSAAIELGPLPPYAMRAIMLKEHMPLATFLDGGRGTIKFTLSLPWVFPRLLVGNFVGGHAVPVVTHTYYDCSNAIGEKDYWHERQQGSHAASLMIPCCLGANAFSRVFFYPLYTPSAFTLGIEIYDSKGSMLAKKDKVKEFSDNGAYWLCDLASLLPKDQRGDYGARLFINGIEGAPIPTRVKVAFDIGHTSAALPCNVCTNFQVSNPHLESKPLTFKWAPLLTDSPGCETWIMNSSPKNVAFTDADILVTFFREEDTATLTRRHTLPPHGFLVIRPDDDAELAAFLAGRPGWLTAQTPNAYTTLYYFSRPPGGVVGGDHGF